MGLIIIDEPSSIGAGPFLITGRVPEIFLYKNYLSNISIFRDSPSNIEVIFFKCLYEKVNINIL